MLCVLFFTVGGIGEERVEINK